MWEILKWFTPNDYFAWQIKFLKAFCLLPMEQRVWKTIQDIICIPHFILILAGPPVFEISSLILNEGSFQSKILNVGLVALHATAVSRLIGWFRTRNEVMEVIAMVKRSTFEFSIFKYGRSSLGMIGNEKIYRKCETGSAAYKNCRLAISSYQKELHSKITNFCTFWYLCYFFYTVSNIAISYTANFFQDTYEKFNPRLNRSSLYRDFVYPLWLPFDYSVSDGHYLAAFFYQPYAYATLMLSFLSVDCLFLNTVIHLKGQVKIVSYAFGHVDENIDQNLTKDQIMIIKQIRIVKCIQELQEIFKAAAKLEEITNFYMLMQNGFGLFILCTLLYVSTMITASIKTSHVITMALVTSTEMFTTCWFCQDFTLQFNKVLEKLYDLDWLNYPPKLRRTLVFTMARLKNPPVFTLGKWANLEIASFIIIMKMAYSFYTLISNANK